MRLLLDTHAFLWSISDSKRLSETARAAVATATATYVSAASIWEVAIKAGQGKLDVEVDELLPEIPAAGFEGLPVRGWHAARVQHLPLHHRDPFDRLLIAQAQAEQLILVSRDRLFDAYDVDVRW